MLIAGVEVYHYCKPSATTGLHWWYGKMAKIASVGGVIFMMALVMLFVGAPASASITNDVSCSGSGGISGSTVSSVTSASANEVYTASVCAFGSSTYNGAIQLGNDFSAFAAVVGSDVRFDQIVGIETVNIDTTGCASNADLPCKANAAISYVRSYAGTSFNGNGAVITGSGYTNTSLYNVNSITGTGSGTIYNGVTTMDGKGTETKTLLNTYTMSNKYTANGNVNMNGRFVYQK